MPTHTVIKISELEEAIKKVLPQHTAPGHAVLINGIIVDPALLQGAHAIDIAGKILHAMPGMANAGAKPTASVLADKRIILGFQIDQELHQ